MWLILGCNLLTLLHDLSQVPYIRPVFVYSTYDFFSTFFPSLFFLSERRISIPTTVIQPELLGEKSRPLTLPIILARTIFLHVKLTWEFNKMSLRKKHHLGDRDSPSDWHIICISLGGLPPRRSLRRKWYKRPHTFRGKVAKARNFNAEKMKERNPRNGKIFSYSENFALSACPVAGKINEETFAPEINSTTLTPIQSIKV